MATARFGDGRVETPLAEREIAIDADGQPAIHAGESQVVGPGVADSCRDGVAHGFIAMEEASVARG